MRVTIEASAESLTDDEIVAQLDVDPESGLAELQSRYGRRVQAIANRILRDEHLAEDVTQEVFAKLFFKSHLYRTGSNFAAWLFEIARNHAVSVLRSRLQAPKAFGDLDPRQVPDPCAHRGLEERELMEALEQAVAKLPLPNGRAFRLCVQQGAQYETAAEILGIPKGTVAIRIMRARQRLFQHLSHLLGRLRRPPACLQAR